jgi:hypothetical protein
VICTPTREKREPAGPMMKGMTYIVRPFMAPLKRSVSLAFASAGAHQLLVGPVSSLFSWQMKVRCSVRATSVGELLW